jgi:hypothetical protein
MRDLLALPLWALVVIPPLLTFVFLLPLWAWSKSRRRIRSLRREVMLWRSEKLLQSHFELNLEVTGIKRRSLSLRFRDRQINYAGKKSTWSVPFEKVKRWRIFDENAQPDFVNSVPIWNLEVQDSAYTHTLDSAFIEDSEARELIQAACVRAFGANESTSLEGLQVELARTERLLHEVNSGNIKMRR